MRRALVGIGAAAALTILTAAPASADELTVSIGGADKPLELPIILAPQGESANTVVPGDALDGTLTVRNDGESAGTLRAYLIRDDAQGPDVLADDPWFSSDVRVTAAGSTDTIDGWGTASQRIGSTDRSGVQIAEVDLAQGASTSMDLSVDFPAESTSGNRAGGDGYAPGVRETTFSVYLVIVGDAVTPAPTPTPSPAAPTTTPAVAPPTAVPPAPGTTTTTAPAGEVPAGSTPGGSAGPTTAPHDASAPSSKPSALARTGVGLGILAAALLATGAAVAVAGRLRRRAMR